MRYTRTFLGVAAILAALSIAAVVRTRPVHAAANAPFILFLEGSIANVNPDGTLAAPFDRQVTAIVRSSSGEYREIYYPPSVDKFTADPAKILHRKVLNPNPPDSSCATHPHLAVQPQHLGEATLLGAPVVRLLASQPGSTWEVWESPAFACLPVRMEVTEFHPGGARKNVAVKSVTWISREEPPAVLFQP